MSINLGTEITNSLEAQGAITTGTTLGGDLTGSMPNPTITSLRGLALPTSGFADGLGLKISGGAWTLQTVLTENSNFTGEISGTQATGLTLNSIGGVSLEVDNPTTGQIIKYNGSNWGLADDSGGYEVVQATSSSTAADMQKIFTNTTSSAITITCPSSPTEGDSFIVYDSHGTAGTNAITIAVASGDSIEGSVDDTLLIDLNNAVVEMYYNGTTWKYYVISLRP